MLAGLSLRDVLSQLHGWAVYFLQLAFTEPASDELVAARGDMNKGNGLCSLF